jgi:hypothetical protein
MQSRLSVNPYPNRKLGRRSEEGTVIDNHIKFSHKLRSQPRQGAMTKSFIDDLNFSKNNRLLRRAFQQFMPFTLAFLMGGAYNTDSSKH